MAGIDSIVNTRADAFTNNPQGLMQRYAMGQDLLDLLALQKLKQDKEAAARSLQMNMQTPQGTIKDQLQGQVMDMTKREVVQAVAPGLQQQGQRMQAEQMQQAMGAGLPTQPAPALQGMAQGGIVGYADGGTPYSRSALDRLERSATESSADRERKRRALLEFEAAIGGGLLPEGTLPPVERYPAQLSREGATFNREGISRDANAAAERYRLMREAQNRPRPADQAEADTADAESSGIMSFFKSLADNYKNAMRIQGEGNRVLYNPGAAQYVSMMENPELAEAGMTDLERAKAMGLIPDERPSRPAPQPTTATASQPTTQAAPTARPAITAPTEEGLAALADNMEQENLAYQRSLNRQHYAAPDATQPKYRSRYEDRLAEIEAEKQDRIGALIDFLQAAGASGGTNLGATLMGGGSGLRTREERLRQQETDALKSIIEDEQAQQAMGFRERELAQQAEQNALTRSLQERIATANRASQEGMTADEIASKKAIAKMQVDEAVKRAEAAAGANIAESQMNALIEARKAMADDELLNQQFMRIQQQYKNNPVEMDVQMQILTDEYLDNYLAPFGLSSGSSNIGGMKTPAPTN